jgi:hypothetical protein
LLAVRQDHSISWADDALDALWLAKEGKHYGSGTGLLKYIILMRL